MKRYFGYILPAILLLGMTACERNDDEPVKVDKSIARLYISTSDYSSGASTNLPNLWVLDPVDQEVLPTADYLQGNISPAMGGKTIFFSPLSDGLIFQASMNRPGAMDTAINVLGVNRIGVVSNKGQLRNRLYDNVRGLYYTVVNSGNLREEYLLAVNKSDTLSYGSMFAFRRPQNAGSGQTRPRFELRLDYMPWGLLVDGSDVYVSKTGVDGGVVAYKGFTENLITKVDTSLSVNDSYRLTIPGANNIAGIAYHKAKDQFFVTDYSGENDAAVGRILIFDNFSSHTTSGVIQPSRVITGVNTGLKQPMDVEVDTREGGQYMFVADPGARRVFRFLLTDEGNVTPNAVLNVNNRVPQSISLDAR